MELENVTHQESSQLRCSQGLLARDEMSHLAESANDYQDGVTQRVIASDGAGDWEFYNKVHGD